MTVEHVGFIGLGIMGLPMVKNLLAHEFHVTTWARREEALLAAVDSGAHAAGSVADVFANCDTVILMLRDEPAVDAVLARTASGFGVDVSGRIIVQMGTFSPEFSRRIAQDVEAAGGRYVEAPVSGSRGPAEAGTLVAMLAGDPDVIDEVSELIAAMCGQQYRCGAVPNALTMKLASNTLLISTVTAIAEAFHFAEANGADPDVLRAVLDGGQMSSTISRAKTLKVVQGDLSAQASIADVLKNARLVENAALTAGSAHPLIRASRELYEEAVAQGYGDLDMIGVRAALDARAAQQQA